MNFDQIIPLDFDVKKLSTNDSGTLFGAKRKNVWHFVIDSAITMSIVQLHVPRYLMADAIDSLYCFNKKFNGYYGMPVSTDESKQVGIFSKGKHLYDLSLFPTENGLPPEFSKKLESDIKLLKKARQQVEQIDDMYILPNEQSYGGYPVASKSRRLIESIAFEKLLSKKLDATKFGIYSAFCTWRDFIYQQEVKFSRVEAIVKNDLEHDLLDDEKFVPLAVEVQSKLFKKQIWGHGISINENEAVEITYKAVQKLSSIQWAQFHLLNGMHRGGLFLPLAPLLDFNLWETYIEWCTKWYQPDSAEEQEIRTETAFIKMLGELGEI